MKPVEKVLVGIGALMVFVMLMSMTVFIYAALGWLVATGWNAVLVPTIEGMPVIEWWQAAIGVWLFALMSKFMRS